MNIITLARIKRNDAKNRMEMAREFFAQSDVFRSCTVGQAIETLRSYERYGLFVITDTELILYHDLD